eukprot:11261582-Karenia_brevis.AAC.1
MPLEKHDIDAVHIRNCRSVSGTPPAKFSIMTWIDNLWVVSDSATNVLSIFDVLEGAFGQWGISFKKGSTQLLPCLGQGCNPPPGWQVVDTINCMGTLICNDGDLSPELQNVKDKTLAVYYCNMRSPKA